MCSSDSDYDPEEVDVEIIPADDIYPIPSDSLTISPDLNADLTIYSGIEEIEIPRGALQVLAVEDFLPQSDDVLLQPDSEEHQETEDAKKTRIFIESIKADGTWARSVPSVKLAISSNPYLTKEVVADLLTHCITRVNNRPRSLTLTSKNVTLDDISRLIKLAFSMKDDELALNNSVVRLYCKNTAKRLKDLASMLEATCKELANVRVSCGDIFAEYKPSTHQCLRYRTPNIHKYIALEEYIQGKPMRVQTSFTIKKRDNPYREITVSWFDEFKPLYGRVTYIHFDHGAQRQTSNRVTFSTCTTQEIDVGENARMYPTTTINHPVHDLIAFLSKFDANKEYTRTS